MNSENKSKNVYQKLAEACYLLACEGTSKSGKANAGRDGRYKYSVMSDFMPPLVEILYKVGLFVLESSDEESVSLTIYNTDIPSDETEIIRISANIPQNTADPSKHSNFPNPQMEKSKVRVAIESYLYRRLYMRLFKIYFEDDDKEAKNKESSYTATEKPPAQDMSVVDRKSEIKRRAALNKETFEEIGLMLDDPQHAEVLRKYLLSRYGKSAGVDLPEQDYEDFIKSLREIGSYSGLEKIVNGRRQ
jgi:hypothetical protein